MSTRYAEIPSLPSPPSKRSVSCVLACCFCRCTEALIELALASLSWSLLTWRWHLFERTQSSVRLLVGKCLLLCSFVRLALYHRLSDQLFAEKVTSDRYRFTHSHNLQLNRSVRRFSRLQFSVMSRLQLVHVSRADNSSAITPPAILSTTT